MRTILLSFTTLAMFSGVAAADRGHNVSHGGGGVRGGGGTHVVSRGGGGGYNRSVSRATPVREFRGGGGRIERDRHVEVRGGGRFEGRRNFVESRRFDRDDRFGRRSFARERFFDYRVRPGVIFENYVDYPGYVWIAGEWRWNGYEWIWYPGHYEAIGYGPYDYGY